MSSRNHLGALLFLGLTAVIVVTLIKAMTAIPELIFPLSKTDDTTFVDEVAAMHCEYSREILPLSRELKEAMSRGDQDQIEEISEAIGSLTRSHKERVKRYYIDNGRVYVDTPAPGSHRGAVQGNR